MRAAISALLAIFASSCLGPPDRLTIEGGKGYGDFDGTCGNFDNDSSWLAAGLEFPITWERREVKPPPPMPEFCPPPDDGLMQVEEPLEAKGRLCASEPPAPAPDGKDWTLELTGLGFALLAGGGAEAYRRKKRRAKS